VVTGVRGHLVALVDRDVPARNLPPEDRNPEPGSFPGPSRFFKAGTNPYFLAYYFPASGCCL
jgi:hypothetical protein